MHRQNREIKACGSSNEDPAQLKITTNNNKYNFLYMVDKESIQEDITTTTTKKWPDRELHSWNSESLMRPEKQMLAKILELLGPTHNGEAFEVFLQEMTCSVLYFR